MSSELEAIVESESQKGLAANLAASGNNTSGVQAEQAEDNGNVNTLDSFDDEETK